MLARDAKGETKSTPPFYRKLQVFCFFFAKSTMCCKQICTTRANFKILKTFIIAKALVSKYFLHFQRNTRWVTVVLKENLPAFLQYTF